MIKIYDNTVPFNVQQIVYNRILHSLFRIKGWEDRHDLDMNKPDLHSNWSFEDLSESKLFPYIYKALNADGGSTVVKGFDKCIVNLTKPGDYHYTHTHGDNTTVVLYYANLEWQDGWAGETLFYDDERNLMSACEYTPGRILKFSGDTPHTIRPQSFKAPQFRFTISVFFKDSA